MRPGKRERCRKGRRSWQTTWPGAPLNMFERSRKTRRSGYALPLAIEEGGLEEKKEGKRFGPTRVDPVLRNWIRQRTENKAEKTSGS